MLVLGILATPVISKKLRIPDLIVLLIFGAIMGPNGLNVLERHAVVTLFGSVGLIYIMFLAGLELDLHRFMSSYKRSVSFGLMTFLILLGSGASLHEEHLRTLSAIAQQIHQLDEKGELAGISSAKELADHFRIGSV